MKINNQNHRRGIDHARAKISYSDVELARVLYDQKAKPVDIAEYIGVSINTLWDWLRYKTRINS